MKEALTFRTALANEARLEALLATARIRRWRAENALCDKLGLKCRIRGTALLGELERVERKAA